MDYGPKPQMLMLLFHHLQHLLVRHHTAWRDGRSSFAPWHYLQSLSLCLWKTLPLPVIFLYISSNQYEYSYYIAVLTCHCTLLWTESYCHNSLIIAHRSTNGEFNFAEVNKIHFVRLYSVFVQRAEVPLYFVIWVEQVECFQIYGLQFATRTEMLYDLSYVKC